MPASRSAVNAAWRGAEMVGLRLRRAAAGDGGLQVHRGEVGRPQNRRDRPERRDRVGQQPRGTAGEVHIPGESQRDTARSANSAARPSGQSRLARGGPAAGGGPRRRRSGRAGCSRKHGQPAGHHRDHPADHHQPSLRVPTSTAPPGSSHLASITEACAAQVPSSRSVTPHRLDGRNRSRRQMASRHVIDMSTENAHRAAVMVGGRRSGQAVSVAPKWVDLCHRRPRAGLGGLA